MFSVHNVPGAFSSNGGEDFRTILEEIARVAQPGISVALPEDGRWLRAGEILGKGFSIAWRCLDAQHWGVPQRRNRVYLVADLGGERAGSILFDHESLSGYSPQSFCAWAGAPDCAESGIALASDARTVAGLDTNAVAFEPGALRRKASPHAWDGIASTLRADMGDNQEAVAYAIPINDKATRFKGGGLTRHNDGAGNGLGIGQPGDPAPTMTAGDRHAVCYQQQVGTLCGVDHKWVQQQQVLQDKLIVERETFSLQRSDHYKDSDVASTQVARQCKDATDLVVEPLPDDGQHYVVRRLTPRECALLQGFPADWCAGLGTPEPTDEELMWWADVFDTSRKVRGMQARPHSRKWLTKWLRHPNSDTAEYKMWGNGIALPCATFVLAGIVWADSRS